MRGVDLEHVVAHGDLLSALGTASEKLRKQMLMHGGHSLKRAVRHGLMLARDHFGTAAKHPAISRADREHLQAMSDHVRYAPKHIASAIDDLIEQGPEGSGGAVWNRIVDLHRDASGGSFFKKLWKGIKRGAKAVGHFAVNAGKEVLGDVAKTAKAAVEKELEAIKEDPLGAAKQLASMAA